MALSIEIPVVLVGDAHVGARMVVQIYVVELTTFHVPQVALRGLESVLDTSLLQSAQVVLLLDPVLVVHPVLVLAGLGRDFGNVCVLVDLAGGRWSHGRVDVGDHGELEFLGVDVLGAES